MTRAHTFALPLIVAAVIGTVPSSLIAQRTFEGAYIASGIDSDGNEYRRAVEIERHGDRFVVMWVSARFFRDALVLEPSWIGVGIATDDILSVSFVAEDMIGVMVYRFAPNGQLTGRWTLEGDDGVICSETLTPLPDVVPGREGADSSQEQRSQPSSVPAISVLSL